MHCMRLPGPAGWGVFLLAEPKTAASERPLEDEAALCTEAGPSNWRSCGFNSCMLKFHGMETIPDPQTS